jgi:hypothetical protein
MITPNHAMNGTPSHASVCHDWRSHRAGTGAHRGAQRPVNHSARHAACRRACHGLLRVSTASHEVAQRYDRKNLHRAPHLYLDGPRFGDASGACLGTVNRHLLMDTTSGHERQSYGKDKSKRLHRFPLWESVSK